MAKPDSLFTKRKAPVKRAGMEIPEPLVSTGKDIVAGVGELKRQSGLAIEKVKNSYRKIKGAIKP